MENETKNKWTKDWPTKNKGIYWFYGWPYGKIDPTGAQKLPELKVLRVQQIANGFMYVLDGHFIFQTEAVGQFLEIERPELPESSIEPGQYNMIYAKGANPHDENFKYKLSDK
jgi:hypothetical protein